MILVFFGYLYILGLSFLEILVRHYSSLKTRKEVTSVWKQLQKFAQYNLYGHKLVSAFIIDETIIQIGSKHYWLQVCIEPIHKTGLELIYQYRNTLVLLCFDIWRKNMVSVQYIQLMVFCSRRPARR